MFAELADFCERPPPFSRYTTDLLWTDPHIGAQMLRYHLEPGHDLASRRASSIDATVAWIDRRLGLAGTTVCDLGCGPGLYTSRMARLGARVTGLDFSPTSIAHARQAAAADTLAISYVEADYLKDPLPGAELFTLIYGDFCTLGPDAGRALLAAIHAALPPGGHFVFDVFAPAQFAARTETSEFDRRYMGGFWAPGDYFGFKRSFLYPDEQVGLDRYLIVTPERRFEIFNWMRYYSPAAITALLEAAGFAVAAILDVVSGRDWNPGPSEFAIVAERRR